jgi:hypothetical protein
MKKIIFLLFLFCQISNVFSQETVKIVTYGSGKTYESALSIALRSSLEQAAGVFISNMAVVKNDSLIYDEVKSISNGTITKYDILAKVFDSANSIHKLTIECEIAPQKFISFAKSVNNSIEFNGNAFVQNINLNKLYKKNEPSVLFDFIEQYFDAVDTNFASLNCLYMRDWEKLYDKDIKVVGGDPFRYSFSPVKYDFFDFAMALNYRYDKTKFLETSWLERRSTNFEMAKKFVKRDVDREVLRIENNKITRISTIDFVSKEYNYDGFKLFDSLYILYDIIEYYNKKFEGSSLGIYDSKNSTRFQGKSYTELTNYWYYRLHLRVNKIINEVDRLSNILKSQEGKFVFVLQPMLTPNDNYKNFTRQLEKIIKALCVNQNASFNQSDYENKYEKLYSIYFIDSSSSPSMEDGLSLNKQPKKYLVRNLYTFLLFKNIIYALHSYANGDQIFAENLLRTDKGVISTYMTGINLPSRGYLNTHDANDYDALVINPKDQFGVVGSVSEDYSSGANAAIRLRYLVSMFAFLDDRELTQLNKFIIASKN